MSRGCSSKMIAKMSMSMSMFHVPCPCPCPSIKGLGARCHVGYKSCFYRSLQDVTEDGVELEFTEDEKVFDPEVVYPGADNPTKL